MEKYGLPVANAGNIFEILRSLGVDKWNRIGKPIAVADYLNGALTRGGLTEEENKNLKYLPQIKVANFNDSNGRVFRGFQLSGIHGVRVFALINGFVPVCGEFQHGCEEVVLDLPGGNIEEGEDCATCAKREFGEEVGLTLEKVFPLGSSGILINARHRKSRNFSFFGIVKIPEIPYRQYRGTDECLGTVLVSLDDWLKLIEREFVQSYSVCTTFLALRRRGEFYGY